MSRKKNWILAEAGRADSAQDIVFFENPDATNHINTLLLMRFWPVIHDHLKKTAYPYSPIERPKPEFELSGGYSRALTFLLYDILDTNKAFFKGKLSCSRESWMIHSMFFLSLPKETEPNVLQDLLGNTRFAGNPPTLIVDKRKAEDFYQITFHSGNGASWGYKGETFVEERIKQVIDTNIKMYEETLDGGILPQDVGAFLTLAYDVYEAY